jgi:hypothetical protein
MTRDECKSSAAPLLGNSFSFASHQLERIQHLQLASRLEQWLQSYEGSHKVREMLDLVFWVNRLISVN